MSGWDGKSVDDDKPHFILTKECLVTHNLSDLLRWTCLEPQGCGNRTNEGDETSCNVCNKPNVNPPRRKYIYWECLECET